MDASAPELNARTALRVAVVTETYPPEINGALLLLSRGGLEAAGAFVR
jgi:hypothetical protein